MWICTLIANNRGSTSDFTCTSIFRFVRDSSVMLLQHAAQTESQTHMQKTGGQAAAAKWRRSTPQRAHAPTATASKAQRQARVWEKGGWVGGGGGGRGGGGGGGGGRGGRCCYRPRRRDRRG
eukprot:COSAG05_NODE_1375_length_5050_cov_3.472632_5_plen_122_part_00